MDSDRWNLPVTKTEKLTVTPPVELQFFCVPLADSPFLALGAHALRFSSRESHQAGASLLIGLGMEPPCPRRLQASDGRSNTFPEARQPQPCSPS